MASYGLRNVQERAMTRTLSHGTKSITDVGVGRDLPLVGWSGARDPLIY